MSKIRFFHPDDAPFVRAKDAIPEEARGRFTKEEVDGTEFRRHHAVPGELELFEVRLDPDLEIVPHAHAEDEIIAVLEGEVRFGNRTYGPGSTISIKGLTLYGFTVGPKGVRFYNFRPRFDMTYFTPAELREVLASRGAAEPA